MSACAVAPSVPSPADTLNGNSSPVPETGAVIGSATLGTTPYGIGYDPSNQFVYVANQGSGNVMVLNGTTRVATITVGTRPTGACFDPLNGYMYIPNSGSNNVSAISGTKIVATITHSSFNGPYQCAYSPASGFVYVTNVNGNMVTVLNGTKVVTAIRVGTYPLGVAYDPDNFDMYVSNTATAANGGSNLSVIGSTTLVATITSAGSFTNPSGIAFDPQNGYLYVGNKNLASPTRAFVTIVDNRSVVTKFNIGQDIFSISYNPANGYVYVASSNNDVFAKYTSDNVAVYNGTTLLANVTVGANCYFSVYDPAHLTIDVVNGYSGTMSMISSLLAEGPVFGAFNGFPNGTADVGQTVKFNTTLWAAGATPDSVSVSADPIGGFACGSPAITTGYPSWAIQVTCTARSPGNNSVWINVSDSQSRSVWAWGSWQVFAHPSVAPLVATSPTLGPVSSSDIGQPITFSVTTSYQGVISSLAWLGLPPGGCLGYVNGSENCSTQFSRPANLSISVTITDGNGLSASSPVLSFEVYPGVLSGVPVPNVTAADAGHSVAFTAAPSGGSGRYSAYMWSGLGNGSCTGTASPRAVCTFARAGIESISVAVMDTNGYLSADGPSLAFVVYPALTTTVPSADRTSADLGQSVTFNTTSTGGSGPYTYQWTGLPSGCASSTTATPICPMGPSTGTIHVGVTVTDTNGFSYATAPGLTVTILSDPVVGAVAIAPRSVSVGDPVTFSVAAAGGAGQFHYHWIGLPTGCSDQNAEQLTCNPTASGTYLVAVNVADGNGFVVLGNQTALVVTESPVTSSVGGLSSVELYGIIAAVVLVAVAGLVLVMIRRRRGRPPSPPTAPGRRPRASRPGP